MEPWQRQPDEPTRWHQRFEVFRLLGHTRTIEECYRASSQLEPLTGSRPGAAWYKAAIDYKWIQRANAWDDHQRNELEAHLSERRSTARANRIFMVEQLLTVVFNVLKRADLSAMEAEQARDFLPTLRLLFHTLLNAHRTEYGPPADVEAMEGLSFTVDDYITAQQQFQSTGLRDLLSDLYPDESSARRIAHQAELNLSRINFSALSANTWHAVMNEAEHAGRTAQLLEIVRTEYPNNLYLAAIISQYAIHSANHG